MCTVEKIERTTVFVKIHGNGEGSIILSEIAPGRIRNLREYVVPKKQIICKVLKVQGNHIELSLRRVTPKEQKEVRETFKQEKSYKSILKSILKDKTTELIEKIEEKERLYEFIENAKEDSKELEKIIGKENTKKAMEIIKTQKQKNITLKKEIKLTTTDPNGLDILKETLRELKNIEIKYISAGKYLLKTESDNIKLADNNIKEAIQEIQKRTKGKKIELILEEKK